MSKLNTIPIGGSCTATHASTIALPPSPQTNISMRQAGVEHFVLWHHPQLSGLTEGMAHNLDAAEELATIVRILQEEGAAISTDEVDATINCMA